MIHRIGTIKWRLSRICKNFLSPMRLIHPINPVNLVDPPEKDKLSIA